MREPELSRVGMEAVMATPEVVGKEILANKRFAGSDLKSSCEN